MFQSLLFWPTAWFVEDSTADAAVNEEASSTTTALPVTVELDTIASASSTFGDSSLDSLAQDDTFWADFDAMDAWISGSSGNALTVPSINETIVVDSNPSDSSDTQGRVALQELPMPAHLVEQPLSQIIESSETSTDFPVDGAARLSNLFAAVPEDGDVTPCVESIPSSIGFSIDSANTLETLNTCGGAILDYRFATATERNADCGIKEWEVSPLRLVRQEVRNDLVTESANHRRSDMQSTVKRGEKRKRAIQLPEREVLAEEEIRTMKEFLKEYPVEDEIGNCMELTCTDSLKLHQNVTRKRQKIHHHPRWNENLDDGALAPMDQFEACARRVCANEDREWLDARSNELSTCNTRITSACLCQLMSLWHAKWCTASEGTCHTLKCGKMRDLWNHWSTCSPAGPCRHESCKSMKVILHHFLQCSNPRCSIGCCMLRTEMKAKDSSVGEDVDQLFCRNILI